MNMPTADNKQVSGYGASHLPQICPSGKLQIPALRYMKSFRPFKKFNENNNIPQRYNILIIY